MFLYTITTHWRTDNVKAEVCAQLEPHIVYVVHIRIFIITFFQIKMLKHIQSLCFSSLILSGMLIMEQQIYEKYDILKLTLTLGILLFICIWIFIFRGEWKVANL